MTSLIVEKDSRYYQYRVLVDGKTVLATTMEAELAEDRTLAFALGFYHESWNSQRLCIGFPIGTKDETLQRIISAVRAS